jgi:hypothetical protein
MTTLEITEGVCTYIVKLPDNLDFQGQVSVLGRFWVKRTARSVTSAVLFSLLMSTMSGLLKSTVLSIILDVSHYTSMLADSSTGSGLYL